MGNIRQRTTTFGYDEVGNLIAEYAPRFYDTDEEIVQNTTTLTHIKTAYSYDALNRLETTTHGDNLEVGTWSPTAAGTQTALLPHAKPVTLYTYDARGNVAKVLDPFGTITRSVYDDLGRLSDVYEDYSSTNEDEIYDRRTTYKYDAADNVRSVSEGQAKPHLEEPATDYRTITAHTYDVYNRLQVSIQATNWSGEDLGHAPPTTNYNYDASDRLLEVINPRGYKTQFRYDELGRQTKVIEAAGAEDDTQRTTTFGYDNADRLLSVWTPRYHDNQDVPTGEERHVVTRFDYDVHDNVITTTEAQGTNDERTTSSEYNKLGLLLSVVDAENRTTRFGYDGLYRRTYQTEAYGNTQLQRTTRWIYDPANNLLVEKKPLAYDSDSGESHTETHYFYDGLNRVTQMTLAANFKEEALGHEPPTYRTQYDVASRVTTELGPVRSDGNTAIAVKYEYDDLHRRKKIIEGVWTYGDPSTFQAQRESTFLFDVADNLIEEVTGKASQGSSYQAHQQHTHYEYDGLNRLTKLNEAVFSFEQRATYFFYDANGNTVSQTRLPEPFGTPLSDPDEIFFSSQTTSFDYDALDRQIKITQGSWDDATLVELNLGHAAPETSFEYDAADNLLKSTNPLHVYSVAKYDRLGRRISVTEGNYETLPDGMKPVAVNERPTTVFEYDKVDNLTAVTNALGTVARFFYDDLDRRYKSFENYLEDPDNPADESPFGRHMFLLFDAADRVEREETGHTTTGESRVVQTNYDYDALHRRVAIREGAGYTDQQIQSQYGHARPVTIFQYDALGNVLQILNPETTTKFLYDDFNNQTTVIQGANDPDKQRVTNSRFDLAGNRIFTHDSKDVQTNYQYDDLNRLTSTVQLGDIEQENLRTTFVYNTHDAQTELQTVVGTTTYSYDRLGRRNALRQSNGHLTEFAFDQANNLLRVADFVEGSYTIGDPPGDPVAFTRTDETKYVYDVLNRIAEVSSPMAAHPTVGVTRHVVSNRYDKLGRLIEVIDRNEEVRTLEYDNYNRLITESWSRFENWQAGDGLDTSELTPYKNFHYEYDSQNNLIASYTGDEKYGEHSLLHQRSFDAFNRLGSDSQRYSPNEEGEVPQLELTYRYDGGHRLVRVTDSLNGVVASEYDAANRLVTRDWSGTAVLPRSVQLTYQPGSADPNQQGQFDLVDSVLFHSSSSAEATDPFLEKKYEYGSLARIESLRYSDAQGMFKEDFLYGYKLSGLLESERRTSDSDDGHHTYTLTFTYDEKGQLENYSYDSVYLDEIGKPAESVTLTYDSNGNPILNFENPQESQQFDPELAFGNRTSLLADSIVEYDDEGNITLSFSKTANNTTQRHEARHFTYDQHNRLIRIRNGSVQYDETTQQWSDFQGEIGSDFTYNAEGKLLSREHWLSSGSSNVVLDQTHYAYDREHVWADLDSEGRLLARYLRGNEIDQLWGRQDVLATLSAEPRHTWYLTDRQNSVIRLISDTSATSDTVRSYLNSKLVHESGTGFQYGSHYDRFRYTGREWFKTEQVQYNRARWYAPGLGRFMSEDPLGFGGGDTNLYRYVNNSAPNATDPSGQFVFIAIGITALGTLTTHIVAEVAETKYEQATAILSKAPSETTEADRRRLQQLANDAQFYHQATMTSFKATLIAASLTVGTAGSVYAAGALTTTSAGSSLGLGYLGKTTLQSTIETGFEWGVAEATKDPNFSLGYSFTRNMVTNLALGWIPGFAGNKLGIKMTSKLGKEILKLTKKQRVLLDTLDSTLRTAADTSWMMAYEGRSFSDALTYSVVGNFGMRGVMNFAGGGIRKLKTGWEDVIHAENLTGWKRFGQKAATVAGYPLTKLGLLNPCFEAGTPLLTPMGHKVIEEIREGDLVLSRDENDPEGPLEAKVVEERFVRTGLIRKVKVRGREFGTTAEHPFFVKRVWRWLPASELQEGDEFLSHDGQWVEVEEVFDTGEYQTVYNLRVADYHTYFVGALDWGFSVWAHNWCKNADIEALDSMVLQREINAIEAKLAQPGLGQTTRQKLAGDLHRLRQQLPPDTPLTGGHGWDKVAAPEKSTPNSVYTEIDAKTNTAIKNTIFGSDGRPIAHVDFRNHGSDAYSGHGHYFGESGNEFFGHHGSGAPHVDYHNLPTGWDRLPPGVQPIVPIGQ